MFRNSTKGQCDEIALDYVVPYKLVLEGQYRSPIFRLELWPRNASFALLYCSQMYTVPFRSENMKVDIMSDT